MEIRVASNCLHWSQLQSHSSHLCSSIPSNRRRNALFCNALVCGFINKSSLLRRTKTCFQIGGKRATPRRAFSENFDSFSEDDIDSIRELAKRLFSEEEEELNSDNNLGSRNVHTESRSRSRYELTGASSEPPWMRTRPEPPYEILPALKHQYKGVRVTAECSVKKAFSSMVLIVRELHSYTLQMRELVFLQDVNGIPERVQREMHASFVWLFQQIFSQTPTLMMYVMILMANFTVHSMSSNAAIAANPEVHYYSTAAKTEMVSLLDQNPKFDMSSSSGKMISVGGGSTGGGRVTPVGSGMDGGDEDRYVGVSKIHHDDTLVNEEIKLWNSIVDEALEMQAEFTDESLNQETMQQFVSPVIAKIEPEDYLDYSRTELKYQEAISQEPHNPLLLSNYAQFLCVVIRDQDRAEEYFKRASEAKPKDAEALSKYATFLWVVKKDITTAEETYLEAIEADPGNAYHAGTYAHFLWNTGGEDTCYPL